MLFCWRVKRVSKAGVFSKLQSLFLARGIPCHLKGQGLRNSRGEAGQRTWVLHSQPSDPRVQDAAELARLALPSPGLGGPGPCPPAAPP